MKRGNYFILILMIVLASGLVSATYYYVSPTGTATWSSCTDINTPCSLSTANANAKAGDTIYIRGGTYINGAIQPTNSGTAGNIIIFTSYNNEKVIFDGVSSTISFEGDSHIKVHGFTVSNSEWMLRIMQGSNNIEISNCTFYNTIPASNGVPRKSLIQEDSTYNWIHHSIFHTAGYASDEGGGVCDDKGGIMSIGNSNTVGASSYNLLENNVFYSGGHHLLQLNDPYNVIRNNHFHNEAWMVCNHCTITKGYTLPVQNYCGNRNMELISPSANWNLIEGNTFSYGGIPPDDFYGTGLEVKWAHNNIIRYNSIFNNSGSGIWLYAFGGPVENNTVYSNTIFHNSHVDSDYLAATPLGHRHLGGICFSNSWYNTIKNNIVYDNYNGPFTKSGANYDLYNSNNIGKNWNDTNGDPKFVDPILGSPFDSTKPDLRLQQGSGAIDAGTWLTTISSSSGTGNTFYVYDADYFMDGWGIIEGDEIQLEGSTKKVRITSIDYDTDKIIVDQTITWTKGQGVSLSYEGNFPDMGAHEFVSELPSKNYYVDNQATGCSQPSDTDYNPGARTCGTGSSIVYNTIQGIFDNMDFNGGEVIEVRSGTYNEKVTISNEDDGAIGNPVILKAKNGEVVKIDGQKIRSRGIEVLSSTTDIIIEGFNINNWISANTGDGIYVHCAQNSECQRIILRSNTINIIQDSSGSGQMAIHFEHCDYCSAENNIISTDDASWSVQTDGFKIGNSDNFILSNNTVVMRNGWALNDNHADCLQMMGCADFTAYGNDFSSTKDSSTQGFFLNIPNDDNFVAKDYGITRIYNNVITGKISNAGISLYCNKPGSSCKYEIYNNIIAQEKTNPDGIGIRVSDDYAIVKNNIIWNKNARTTIAVENTNQNEGDIDYNLHFSSHPDGFRVNWEGLFYTNINDWKNIYGPGNNENNGDPLLDSEFMQISLSVDVIDKGVNLNSIFNIDKKGVVRPQGNRWDIGAYEFINNICIHSSDTNCDGKVDISELILYISRWKNNDGVLISDLMEAIGIWKNG
ncbi:MAG: right-handed parallel beta-helix repeat-containing protein [archaeon]